MTIERDSAHFRILEHLCAMPKTVRGIVGGVLERRFGAPDAGGRRALRRGGRPGACGRAISSVI
jgi:hypothetical protein